MSVCGEFGDTHPKSRSDATALPYVIGAVSFSAKILIVVVVAALALSSNTAPHVTPSLQLTHENTSHSQVHKPQVTDAHHTHAHSRHNPPSRPSPEVRGTRININASVACNTIRSIVPASSLAPAGLSHVCPCRPLPRSPPTSDGARDNCCLC